MNYDRNDCSKRFCLTQQIMREFDDCYDIDGISYISASIGLSNPFTNCDGNGKYILNENDKNCYSSP